MIYNIDLPNTFSVWYVRLLRVCLKPSSTYLFFINWMLYPKWRCISLLLYCSLYLMYFVVYHFLFVSYVPDLSHSLHMQNIINIYQFIIISLEISTFCASTERLFIICLVRWQQYTKLFCVFQLILVANIKDSMRKRIHEDIKHIKKQHTIVGTHRNCFFFRSQYWRKSVI